MLNLFDHDDVQRLALKELQPAESGDDYSAPPEAVRFESPPNVETPKLVVTPIAPIALELIERGLILHKQSYLYSIINYVLTN